MRGQELIGLSPYSVKVRTDASANLGHPLIQDQANLPLALRIVADRARRAIGQPLAR